MLTEAKKLKHDADRESDAKIKSIKYLRSILLFCKVNTCDLNTWFSILIFHVLVKYQTCRSSFKLFSIFKRLFFVPLTRGLWFPYVLLSYDLIKTSTLFPVRRYARIERRLHLGLLPLRRDQRTCQVSLVKEPLVWYISSDPWVGLANYPRDLSSKFDKRAFGLVRLSCSMCWFIWLCKISSCEINAFLSLCSSL